MPLEAKVIAEVASNHSGSIELAKEFIRIAAQSGADYVKFQSYRFEDLIKKDDPQSEWVEKTQLHWEVYPELIEECTKNKIKFLTTCFSVKYVKTLSRLGLKEIKLASPDLMNFRMIEALTKYFDHLIISTGMHTRKEIEQAIEFINIHKINVTLLHAVSLYPAPSEKAWMNKFIWLKSVFPKVGYSDHVAGVEVAKFAMANGASIIEKHFKLGKYGPGRATSWDALPEEMEELIAYRKFLGKIMGAQINLSTNDWLDEAEISARSRFMKRWKNE